MLMRIIRHEMRLLFADRTVWLVVGLFGLIVVYGLLNGVSQVRRLEARMAGAEADQHERLTALQEEAARVESGEVPAPPVTSDPRSPSVVGGGRGRMFASAPPAPLAALCIGQSDLYPSSFKVSSRSKRTFLDDDEIQNPTNLLSGRFDLGFVTVYLFPLVILALAYDVLSSEREQGTLAMALAQPVRLRSLITAKILARFGLVAILTVGLTTLGLCVAGFAPTRAETLSLLILWVGVVLTYAAFWFALAVVVNSMGWGSAANAVTLAGAWMILVVVVPAMASVAATSLYPVPSRVELIQAMREASSEASRQGSGLLARFYEDHPELAPPDMDVNPADFMVSVQAVQASVDEAVEPIAARYDRQLTRQQEFVDRLRFISPAIVVQEALNDVCGNGLARHRRFLNQVERYHQDWQAFFVPRIMRRELLSTSDFNAIPRFLFEDETVNPIALRVTIGLIGLFLPTAFLGAFGLAMLRRVPVAG